MASIILVSDTHLHINIINKIVAYESAVGILHAGDIGLFDKNSENNITKKELKLIIKHHNPIREAISWMESKTLLAAPMIAVPGNHEDFNIVEAIASQQIKVPNLQLLFAGQRLQMPLGNIGITVMGLGKILAGNKLDPSPIYKENQIQPQELTTMAAAKTDKSPDILLFHLPPALHGPLLGTFGNEVITNIIKEFKPRIAIVGHMHCAYKTHIGPSMVVGLGYGAKGEYAVMNENFQIQHKSLNNSVNVHEVEPVTT